MQDNCGKIHASTLTAGVNGLASGRPDPRGCANSSSRPLGPPRRVVRSPRVVDVVKHLSPSRPARLRPAAHPSHTQVCGNARVCRWRTIDVGPPRSAAAVRLAPVRQQTLEPKNGCWVGLGNCCPVLVSTRSALQRCQPHGTDHRSGVPALLGRRSAWMPTAAQSLPVRHGCSQFWPELRWDPVGTREARFTKCPDYAGTAAPWVKVTAARETARRRHEYCRWRP